MRWSSLRGSCIAKIIGKNVIDNPQFEKIVKMYVYEEIVNNRKLSEIINTEHENVKYLPGHKLPVTYSVLLEIFVIITIIKWFFYRRILWVILIRGS